jgi:flagellar biosynthesis chaperone FliJ
MGSELTARRNEIAQALAMQGSMLTAEQQTNLQRQLGVLDNAIRQQGLAVTQRGQDLSMDQFLRQLALNEWDRNNYWDYARTFGL